MSDTEIGRHLERRRRAVGEQWTLGRETVVIGAGDQVHLPGRGDRTYPFRAHSEYFYLTDRERPGGVLVFDPEEGWVDFVTPVSRDELLWEGAPADEPEGVPVAQLTDWLAARRDRPIVNLGAAVDGVAAEPQLTAELRLGLNQVRRQKDAVELDRMRAAERATRAGFETVVTLLSAGRTERQLQIELEAEFFRHGAHFLAFDTIVASGTNAAVLHFAPTSKLIRAGELVLIDAGAEYRGYASDVTRTYPASGSFTPEQAALHELVQSALGAATRCCTAGTEFRDVHRTAALVIAEGLIEFGLLRGRPESLVQSAAVSLFFPHGVGHMVGLGVRDAGESLPGRRADPSTPRLRIDLPLQPGHVVTIEPGIYVIPALLGDPDVRKRHREHVNWDRADELLNFGGIRIENNVLVTAGGYEVLTDDIPMLG